MRGQLYTGNPLAQEKERNIQGIWAEYAPRTNLIWLLFILKNLMKHVEQKDYNLHPISNAPQNQSRQPLQSRPEKANKGVSPSPADEKKKNTNINGTLMTFQTKLSDRLNQILAILDLERGRDDMCCAADLVAYAIDQRWLDEGDFFLA
jgi:serine/threonine-protein kinase haspin